MAGYLSEDQRRASCWRIIESSTPHDFHLDLSVLDSLPVEYALKLQFEAVTRFDPESKKVVQQDAREFSCGVAPVKLNGKWGYIDRSAKYLIQPQFEGAMPFYEGMARVSADGRWGYIDETGQFLIEPKYVTGYDFHEGRAGVRLSEKGPYGYIDTSGRVVIDPAYAYIRHFSEGLAAVTPVGERFERFITATGEPAFKGEYLGAHDFQQGLCRVSTLETSAYIDQQGTTVWEGPYVDRP